MPDSEIEVNGGIVVYEFVGPEDGEVVVITPGGRFSKDFGGIHELADALGRRAASGCCSGTVPTAASPTCSSTVARSPTCGRRRWA